MVFDVVLREIDQSRNRSDFHSYRYSRDDTKKIFDIRATTEDAHTANPYGMSITTPSGVHENDPLNAFGLWLGLPNRREDDGPWGNYGVVNDDTPSAYRMVGLSDTMSTVIALRVSESDKWPTRIMAPMIRRESTKDFQWETALYVPDFLDVLPEGGIPNELIHQFSSSSASITRRGLGISIDMNFAATPKGLLTWKYQVNQATETITNSLNLDAIFSMTAVWDTPAYWKKYFDSRIHTEHLLHERMMEEVTDFAGVQKDERYIYSKLDKMKSILKARGIDFTDDDCVLVVTPETAQSIVRQPAYFEYDRTGVPNGEGYLPSSGDLKIRGVGMVVKSGLYHRGPGMEPLDPLTRYVQIGEHVFMNWRVDSVDKPGYETSDCDVCVYDEKNNVNTPIYYRELIDKALLFEPNGPRLTNPVGERFFYHDETITDANFKLSNYYRAKGILMDIIRCIAIKGAARFEAKMGEPPLSIRVDNALENDIKDMTDSPNNLTDEYKICNILHQVEAGQLKQYLRRALDNNFVIGISFLLSWPHIVYNTALMMLFLKDKGTASTFYGGFRVSLGVDATRQKIGGTIALWMKTVVMKPEHVVLDQSVRCNYYVTGHAINFHENADDVENFKRGESKKDGFIFAVAADEKDVGTRSYIDNTGNVNPFVLEESEDVPLHFKMAPVYTELFEFQHDDLKDHRTRGYSNIIGGVPQKRNTITFRSHCIRRGVDIRGRKGFNAPEWGPGHWQDTTGIGCREVRSYGRGNLKRFLDVKNTSILL